MTQNARLLRWTNTSISFWRRADAFTPREIQFSLLSANKYTYSQTQTQTYKHQIDKLNNDYNPKRIFTSKVQQALSIYAFWIQQYMGLIDVESNWLLIWNLINYFGIAIILIGLLFILLTDTMQASQYQTVGFNIVSKNLFFVVFIIDMLLVRYRIPLLIQGKFIKDPIELIPRYLKGFIVIDLITIILLYIKIDEAWQWQYMRVLMFLKYKTALQIDDQIKYKLISYRVIMVFYKYFKFMISLVFCTTFYACLYLIIDYNYVNQQGQYYQQGMLWLTSSSSVNFINLCEQFDWQVWFQYSLYLILETMRGCGYGQMTPRNPPQVLFVNLSMLTLMALFAYFIKRIIDISVSYSIQKEQLLVESTSNLRSLQQAYHISENDTIKYLEQITRKYKKEEIVIESIANSYFSDDLRCKFNYYFKLNFILSSKILFDISADDQLGNTFRMQLSQVIQSKKSYKGEYFYRKSTISEEILYLSEQGRIKLQNLQIGVTSKTHNWGFVGVREFFIDKKSTFDVTSMAILKISFLKKWQFMPIIKKHRNIYQRYCEELDFIKLNHGNTQTLNLTCLNCKRYHLFGQCFPYNSYKENFFMFRVKSQNQNQQQSIRKSYKRKKIVCEKLRQIKLQIKEKDCYYLSSKYFISYNF